MAGSTSSVRTCISCGTAQPLSDYRPSFKAGNYRRICKDCERAKARQRYADSTERQAKQKAKPRISRESQRAYSWRRQGIIDVEYAELLYQKNGLCELLCGHQGQVVDHDHETGAIRGWLCRGCNRALGRLGDTKESLLRVARYAQGEPL